jgi:epoxyqueuosine reductase
MNNQQLSYFIKQTALQLGFDYCGIAKAAYLEDDAKRLEQWLHKGFNAGMQYMENNFDKRVNPSLLVNNAKSVVTLLKNYYPSIKQNTPLKIAKYAYGEDYHTVIRKQLNIFLATLQQKIGHFEGRGFVDSAPVLERTWAVKSGLGWVGKNGNLITKQQGSFFFIASLIIDVELAYDDPFVKDFCGTCTKCIDACPTQAILPNKEINSNQCISYYTIELKEAFIPNHLHNQFDNWMFGCDTCQDVCPWNKFSQPHNEQAFNPIPELLQYSTADWQQLTEATFKQIFKHSPLKRSKLQGIQRNINFLQKK